MYGKISHFLVTLDGSDYMSYEAFKLMCQAEGLSSIDPDAPAVLKLAGITWRPEAFGSVCYKKAKAARSCTEIKSKAGKYIFINDGQAPLDI